MANTIWSVLIKLAGRERVVNWLDQMNKKDNLGQDEKIDSLKRMLTPSPVQAKTPTQVQNPTVSPTRPPTPTVSVAPPNTITIPSDNGMKQVPQDFANDLFKAMGDIQMATPSAEVLHHPNQQTYTPEEIKRIGKESWNRGENPDFSHGLMEAPNPDGTHDYGAGRTNSFAFQDMKRQPFWNAKMKENGINSIDDLADRYKALRMMRLQFLRDNWDNYQKSKNEQGGVDEWKEKPSFKSWYASPVKLK